MGLAQIPELMIDNTDRNRTSPFAFTGNRFEFRAVGSSANCAAALLALNAAVADQLNDFHSKVEKRIKRWRNTDTCDTEEVKALIISSKPIHFDGNGYSEEWKQEAERRGLDCETSAPKDIRCLPQHRECGDVCPHRCAVAYRSLRPETR